MDPVTMVFISDRTQDLVGDADPASGSYSTANRLTLTGQVMAKSRVDSAPDLCWISSTRKGSVTQATYVPKWLTA